MDDNQLELFKLAACGCGHLHYAIEEGEPCPTCLDRRAGSHDCPLVIDEELTAQRREQRWER